MSRDYVRASDYYQLHELQPPGPHYQHYDLLQQHGANASAATAYELTASGAGECASGGALAPTPAPLGSQPLAHSSHAEHERRKRKSLSHFNALLESQPLLQDSHDHSQRDSTSHFPSQPPFDAQPPAHASFTDLDQVKRESISHFPSQPPFDSQPPAHASFTDLDQVKRESISHFPSQPPFDSQPPAHASFTDLDQIKRESISHFPSQLPFDSQPPASASYTDLDQHKKNFSHISSSGEEYEMSGCEATTPSSLVPQAMPKQPSAVRKRKPSSYGTASTYEDDGTDDSRSTRTGPDKKQNHSEIEKRRRDKMNTYITELSSLIPMCGAMSRKLDKLTVLRMAVQHLKSVRGALTACPLSAPPRPAFLSERELNSLILQMAEDCFLLVVGCDRGRLLYVSTSVKNLLHYEQSELLGQSLFDILHPKDVAKVKEQLSSSDLSPRERLIDIKTMMPVKADVVTGASRFCPGARRSFLCRIKCKAAVDEGESSTVTVKEESESTTKLRKKPSQEKKYCVVQCTGYLKSWAPADEGGPRSSTEGSEDTEACSMSCLVAVMRTLPDMALNTSAAPATPTRPMQYVSRHAIDGKYLFVDQRVTVALGFLPQELLGTSLYEYVSGPELGAVAGTHKQALLRRVPMHTPTYSFRRKDGTFARIQTHFKPFKNPWTKDVESLVANNTLITDSQLPTEQDTAQTSYDVYKNQPESDLAAPSDFPGVSEADVEMQRLIESQVESHKIGSAIAEEALRRSSTEYSPDMSSDLLQDAVFHQGGSYINRKPLKVDATIAEETLRRSSAEYSPGLPPDLLPDDVFNQSSMDNLIGLDSGYGSQVRNNVPLSSVGAASTPPPAEASVSGLASGAPPPVSPPLPPLGLDGNGEAAMAVIMSLLEADAGLGGPVNFSGLPWPLP